VTDYNNASKPSDKNRESKTENSGKEGNEKGGNDAKAAKSDE
jgi:hypothetical protein